MSGDHKKPGQTKDGDNNNVTNNTGNGYSVGSTPVVVQNTYWKDYNPEKIETFLTEAQQTNTEKVLDVKGIDHKISPKEAYALAKNGNVNAAKAYTDYVFKTNPEAVEKLIEGYASKNPILQPVVAMEKGADGKSYHNVLPEVFAAELSYMTGWQVAGETPGSAIVQTNKWVNPNGTNVEKLLNKPVFAGHVEKDRNYVIIDGNARNGTAVRNMLQYIEDNGGKVVGASGLNVEGSDRLKPSAKNMDRAQQELGDKNLSKLHSKLFNTEPSDMKSFNLSFTGGELNNIHNIYEKEFLPKVKQEVDATNVERAKQKKAPLAMPEGKDLQNRFAEYLNTEINNAQNQQAKGVQKNEKSTSPTSNKSDGKSDGQGNTGTTGGEQQSNTAGQTENGTGGKQNSPQVTAPPPTETPTSKTPSKLDTHIQNAKETAKKAGGVIVAAASSDMLGHAIGESAAGISLGIGVKGLYDKFATKDNNFHKDIAAGGNRKTAAIVGATADAAAIGTGSIEAAHGISNVIKNVKSGGNIAKLAEASEGFGVAAKIAGRAAIPIALVAGAADTYAAIKAKDGHRAAQSMGGTLGAIAIGAAVGSIIPVAGTAVGAAVGLVVGVGAAILGGIGGSKLMDWAFGDKLDEHLKADDVKKQEVGQWHKRITDYKAVLEHGSPDQALAQKKSYEAYLTDMHTKHYITDDQYTAYLGNAQRLSDAHDLAVKQAQDAALKNAQAQANEVKKPTTSGAHHVDDASYHHTGVVKKENTGVAKS